MRHARAAELNARIVAALRAEPFDSTGFVMLLDGDRDSMARRLEAAHAAFAAQVAGLTQSERREMAERLENDLDRHSRR